MNKQSSGNGFITLYQVKKTQKMYITDIAATLQAKMDSTSK